MLQGKVVNFIERTKWNHHPNLPREFRMGIFGKSGSGKTCLLFQLVCEPDFIDYDNIMIFAPSHTIQQQELQLLYHGLSNGLKKETTASMVINQEKLRKDFPDLSIKKLCELMSKVTSETSNSREITITMSSEFESIPDPTKLDRNKKNLIVFEDCKSLNHMQPVINYYMTSGRQASCNAIILYQGYTSLKAAGDIRENLNVIVFLNQTLKQLSVLYDILGAGSMNKFQFTTFASNAFQKYDGHGHIAFNLQTRKLYDNIFEEKQTSDDESD